METYALASARLFMPVWHTEIASAFLHLNLVERAREHLDVAVSFSEQGGENWSTPFWWSVEHRYHLATGNPTAAGGRARQIRYRSALRDRTAITNIWSVHEFRRLRPAIERDPRPDTHTQLRTLAFPDGRHHRRRLPVRQPRAVSSARARQSPRSACRGDSSAERRNPGVAMEGQREVRVDLFYPLAVRPALCAHHQTLRRDRRRHVRQLLGKRALLSVSAATGRSGLRALRTGRHERRRLPKM